MAAQLPTLNDYQTKLQSPKSYLWDPRLKNSIVEKDQMGLPKVSSGGFALTYKLSSNGKIYALRCFHKAANERESRYSSICKYINNNSSRFFINVEYLPKGILHNGEWLPITLMDWVEGFTLSNYVYQFYKDKSKIQTLINDFVSLAKEIEKLNIAHGDLSHQNIIVKNLKLVLIDYDGMFLPEFSGKKSNELGNKNFQHPRRTDFHFNKYIDRFSEIVIYLSLQSILISPTIYEKYGKGADGLIFERNDFINPDHSKLINELRTITELKPIIIKFIDICKGDIDHIPNLNDFVEQRNLIIPIIDAPLPEQQLVTYIPIINAINKGTVLENVGEFVTVIAEINEIHQAVTRNGKPYAMLNCGTYPKQSFSVVLWSEALDMLRIGGYGPHNYEDKWISVTGLLSTYRNKPQIVLDSPSNIEIITKDIAHQRLSQKAQVQPQRNPPNTAIKEFSTNDEIRLNTKVQIKTESKPTQFSQSTQPTGNRLSSVNLDNYKSSATQNKPLNKPSSTSSFTTEQINNLKSVYNTTTDSKYLQKPTPLEKEKEKEKSFWEKLKNWLAG
jgi:hypothetical protein